MTKGPQQGRGRIDITINGVRVELSPELEAAEHRAYQGAQAPLPREISTFQVAVFLEVSPPFGAKPIQRGSCRAGWSG